MRHPDRNTLTLEDSRIPDTVREAFRAAESEGHRLSLFEPGHSSLYHPTLVIEAWVPWSSPVAASLRKAGAHDAYMDQCVAEMDPREQFVAWESPRVEKEPRLFSLVRDTDATGVSGIGRVADGVEWADKTCAVRWRTEHRSTTVYDNIASVEKIHGHGGATRVVFADGGSP